MLEKTARMTFVLPVEIAESLKKFVPNRKRSEFVAEAIEQRLMETVYRQGRELSFGAWKDEDHPELCGRNGVGRYIDELRNGSLWRRDMERGK